MAFQKGVLASLPGREMRDLIVPGGLFQPADLRDQPISTSLAAAIDVLAAHCAEKNFKLILVGRPEIYTHGETRAWLARQIGSIRDHVALSDGSTIHLISGLRNHLFCYNPHHGRAHANLKRLVARASEIPGQLAGQVNHALSFWKGDAEIAPATTLVQATAMPAPAEKHFCNFYLNAHSVEDSILRQELLVTDEGILEKDFSEILYLPFTHASTEDKSFCQFAAQRINESLARPKRLLILGVPPVELRTESAASMRRSLLTGLNHCHVLMPRVSLPNVVLATAPIDPAAHEQDGRKFHLILPEHFPFWQFPKEWYRNFDSVRLAIPELLIPERTRLLTLHMRAMGRRPQIAPITQTERARLEQVPAYV